MSRRWDEDDTQPIPTVSGPDYRTAPHPHVVHPPAPYVQPDKLREYTNLAVEVVEGLGFLVLAVMAFIAYWIVLTTIVMVVWPGDEATWFWWALFLGPIIGLCIWARVEGKKPHAYQDFEGRCLQCPKDADHPVHTPVY